MLQFKNMYRSDHQKGLDMDQKKKIASYLRAILSVILLTALDQYTKWLAVMHLKEKEPFVIIKDFFQLQYLENRGAAFGMLQNRQIFFYIITCILLAVIGFCYYRMPAERKFLPLRACAVFISAGAIGNFIDRVRLGYVVDFFYFELIDFPIFNVADIYVTVTTILLAILVLFVYKEEDLKFLCAKKESL